MYKQTSYKDLYFRLVASLLGAHLIIAIGETDSIFVMLMHPWYYVDLLVSFIIAFVLFSIIRYLFIRLDRKFSWHEHLVARIGLQLSWGIVLPALADFLLVALFLKVRNGTNILNTSYLRYDFWLVTALLVAINIYYLAFYFYEQWAFVHAQNQRLQAQNQTLERLVNDHTKDTIRVSKGSKSIMLHFNDIAYLFREDEANYLSTMAGEKFFLSESLDEMQQQLPSHMFFRANRQTIVHRQTCKGYDLLTYGKLRARLEPTLEQEVVVSQKTAVAFKRWLDN